MTKSKEAHDNQFVNSNMDPTPVVESEASVTAINTIIASSIPERSDPTSKECSFAHLNDDIINSAANMCNNNRELICETRPSDKDASAQSMIDSANTREQPSTPERSSDPSLEERTSQPSSSNLVTNTVSSYEQPSTPERPSGPSLEEQFRDPSLSNTLVIDTDVYMADSEVADINAHDEFEPLENLTVYEVVTEYQGDPPISATNYPHIFLQLRDGQIINVENGEIIISLSQFVATDESAEPLGSDTTSIFSSQTSPRPLNIDSDYMTSTQESSYQQEVSVNDDIIRPPAIKSVFVWSRRLTVIVESTLEDVEEEVMREVRSLISDPPPEGWLDDERRMTYHTNKSEWGSEGVTNEEMVIIKKHHACKVPTNADCIKQLNGHEEVDDPRVPDHIHYRRCKRPTTLEEVYRRWSFRIRRRAYFARPAVFIEGLWFPELYLPDPEDPEWSWKEGIRVDRPAQSLYQLNEGKVFWDPFKQIRVNGVHPYYRWPTHDNCIQRQITPNPIRHVKRPTEQFIKFSIERCPQSHFTTRERPDCVQYHPLYKGFSPLGDGSTSDLIDLTQNNQMFCLPKTKSGSYRL